MLKEVAMDQDLYKARNQAKSMLTEQFSNPTPLHVDQDVTPTGPGDYLGMVSPETMPVDGDNPFPGLEPPTNYG